MLRLASLAFAILAASSATAQDAAPEDEARARFQAGREAFAAERYEEALAEFRRAYELSPRPELLYNIGAACERLARDEEAIDAYRGFVAALPEHEQRAEAERRIGVLEARLRATATRSPEPTPAAPPPSSGGWLWSWIALGATAIAGASIGLSWALANDAYASLEASCGARGCTDEEIAASEVQARIDATNSMIIVTGVLAACTALLFVLEAPSGSAPATALRIGPGSIALEGAF